MDQKADSADVMRALSIRKPFAELILRGIKTAEYRTRPTRIIGERFFIYGSKGGKWNDQRGTPNDERRTTNVERERRTENAERRTSIRRTRLCLML